MRAVKGSLGHSPYERYEKSEDSRCGLADRLFEHPHYYVACVALDGAHVAYDNALASTRFQLFDVGCGVNNWRIGWRDK